MCGNFGQKHCWRLDTKVIMVTAIQLLPHGTDTLHSLLPSTNGYSYVNHLTGFDNTLNIRLSPEALGAHHQ